MSANPVHSTSFFPILLSRRINGVRHYSERTVAGESDLLRRVVWFCPVTYVTPSTGFSPGLTAWALLKYQVNKWLITINIDRQIDGWMNGWVFRFNGRPGAGTELRRPRRHLNFQANDYWVTWQHNGEGETVPIFSGAVAV